MLQVRNETHRLLCFVCDRMHGEKREREITIYIYIWIHAMQGGQGREEFPYAKCSNDEDIQHILGHRLRGCDFDYAQPRCEYLFTALSYRRAISERNRHIRSVGGPPMHGCGETCT